MPKIAKDISPLQKKVNDFLEHLEIEKGASPLTIRNYKHYLGRLNEWLKKTYSRAELEMLDQELVRRYRIYLSHLNLSLKTQGYHIIALRSFLKWLVKNDYQVLSPEKIDLPKAEGRQIKFLNGEQIDRLLNAPSLAKVTGKRDRAILEVFFSTGLRVSELVKLDRDKIDLKRREFGIIGKGKRARVVFLSKRSAEWIDKYLGARDDNFKPLFIRHKGKIDPTTSESSMRLTARSIQRLVKKYARKVKLPIEATPHVIRHSYATDLLMAGADLRSVQEMLGHKNVSTTQIYTHVTNKQLRNVHEAFHGKGGKE